MPSFNFGSAGTPSDDLIIDASNSDGQMYRFSNTSNTTFEMQLDGRPFEIKPGRTIDAFVQKEVKFVLKPNEFAKGAWEFLG